MLRSPFLSFCFICKGSDILFSSFLKSSLSRYSPNLPFFTTYLLLSSVKKSVGIPILSAISFSTSDFIKTFPASICSGSIGIFFNVIFSSGFVSETRYFPNLPVFNSIGFPSEERTSDSILLSLIFSISTSYLLISFSSEL